MEIRQLGNSDLKITVLGFGAWAVGGAGWLGSMGPQNEDDCVRKTMTSRSRRSAKRSTTALIGSTPPRSTALGIPRRLWRERLRGEILAPTFSPNVSVLSTTLAE